METDERNPQWLAGWQVVEAGRRQAWPFLTLAEPATGHEVRLYVDTSFDVEPSFRGVRQHDDRALLALDSLNGATVTDARTDAGRLHLRFAEGLLVVAAAGNDLTAHAPWWLGRPLG